MIYRGRLGLVNLSCFQERNNYIADQEGRHIDVDFKSWFRAAIRATMKDFFLEVKKSKYLLQNLEIFKDNSTYQILHNGFISGSQFVSLLSRENG